MHRDAASTSDRECRVSQLLRSGLVLDQPDVDIAAEAGTPVTVIDLPTPGRGTEYKLGLKNFYVLTRYNRSFFYALAVYQLGMRVKAQMLATQPGVGVGPANGNAGNGGNGGGNGGNGNGNGMNGAPNGTGTTPPGQQD